MRYIFCLFSKLLNNFSPLELRKIEEHIMSVLSNIPPYDIPKKADTFDIISIVARMENERHIDVTDQLWSVLRCQFFTTVDNFIFFSIKCFSLQFAVVIKIYCSHYFISSNVRLSQ